MDLVDYSEDRFKEIEAQIAELAKELNLANYVIIPVSATEGDNITTKSENTPWYTGVPLLEYLENVDVEEKTTEKSNELKNLKTVKNRQDKLKFTYKEQREYETIDDDIAALEEKIEKLEQDIVTNARDFVKLNELTKEKETTQALLDEKMDRWVYLQDLAERIEQQNH